MRKLYIVFFTIILLIISFFVGQYIYKISRIDDNLLAQYTEMHNQYEQIYKPTATTDNTKISPNANIIFKTTYEGCGHTLNKYETASENDVNLTKEEFQKLYKTWEITDFSEKQVVLLQKKTGSCNQHYVIREKDGNLAVYIIGDNNEEKLKEETNISTMYLTEVDLLKLEEGIRVNGLEELNSKLEDFE